VADATPDYAGAYADLRGRVDALLREQPADALDGIAPATPAWRVRDVLAHMVGVCDDITQGNMAGVATDEWTDAQVVKRCDLPVADVLDEWSEVGPAIEQVMRDAPMEAFGQLMADAVTHEQDIRGALGAPGGRDAPALAIGVEWGLGVIGRRMRDGGEGSLRVEHDDGSVDLGEGEPRSTLRASRFEVGRAMAGRRSRAQMRAYDWQGDFEPDGLLMASFFVPPEADLVE